MSIYDCEQVGPECPVEGSIYGYYPSVPANAFLVAAFTTCFFVNLGFGIRYKTWTYMIAMLLGCTAETLGYAGRLMMHNNPYDQTSFIMQICCLNVGPAFNSAAIYLTLKHICLTFGPEWSRIKPAQYTYVFITADAIALTLQAAGGAMAATAGEDMAQLDRGDHIAMAGMTWQVFTLTCFGAAVIDYIIRRSRAATKSNHPLSPTALSTLKSLKFKLFALAVLIAHLSVFTRCTFRIVEFAGGWGNPIMRDETTFIVLEGVMIILATFLQTFIHPGIFFPPLSFSYQKQMQVQQDEKNVGGIATTAEMDSGDLSSTTDGFTSDDSVQKV